MNDLLSNTKRLERSQKSTKVHDDRIISILKKNNFTRSNHVSENGDYVQKWVQLLESVWFF